MSTDAASGAEAAVPGRGDTPVPTGLVTLIVGDTGRSGGARNRPRRPPGAATADPGQAGEGARGGTGGEAAPGPKQWSCQWSEGGPGLVSVGCQGEAALTLTLSPGDAELIREGLLTPSVAFMQGRLKTAGDNALLLRVLAWSATPAFGAAVASWSRELGGTA